MLHNIAKHTQIIFSGLDDTFTHSDQDESKGKSKDGTGVKSSKKRSRTSVESDDCQNEATVKKESEKPPKSRRKNESDKEKDVETETKGKKGGKRKLKKKPPKGDESESDVEPPKRKRQKKKTKKTAPDDEHYESESDVEQLKTKQKRKKNNKKEGVRDESDGQQEQQEVAAGVNEDEAAEQLEQQEAIMEKSVKENSEVSESKLKVQHNGGQPEKQEATKENSEELCKDNEKREESTNTITEKNIMKERNNGGTEGKGKESEDSVMKGSEKEVDKTNKSGPLSQQDDNGSSEELIITKTKASEVSLRRSARRQKQKADQKAKLQLMHNGKYRGLAAKFILSESSVTYRPPVGFYGNFGSVERNVLPQSEKLNEDEEEDGSYSDASSSSIEVVNDRKPKTGFISNEVVELTSDEEDVTKKIVIRSDVGRFYKWGGGGGSRGGIHFKTDFERYMEGDPSDYMPSTDDRSDYKVPRGNDRYENMPSTDYETDNGYESDNNKQ